MSFMQDVNVIIPIISNYLKFMEGLRTDHSNTSSVRCSLEAAGAKEDGCGLIYFDMVSGCFIYGLTWFVDVCCLS